MHIDCTKPIVISATGQDAEGNTVNIANDRLKLSVIVGQGNFGALGAMSGETFVERTENDTRPWAFNPGDAGATGGIVGEYDDDSGTAYKDELDLELVPGALRSIKLNMQPVPIEGNPPASSSTPEDTSAVSSGSTDTVEVTPAEVGDASAVLDPGAQ